MSNSVPGTSSTTRNVVSERRTSSKRIKMFLTPSEKNQYNEFMAALEELNVTLKKFEIEVF